MAILIKREDRHEEFIRLVHAIESNRMYRQELKQTVHHDGYDEVYASMIAAQEWLLKEISNLCPRVKDERS